MVDRSWGWSHSVSYFAHRRHRLERVDRNNHARSPCGMCQQPVLVGEVAYRCARSCGFVLHGACCEYPRTIRRLFAHPDHRLTLASWDQSRDRSCSLCAGRFHPLGIFVYGCDQQTTDHRCHGFYAHPRCCDLPQHLTATSNLHLHELTLMPPSPGRGRRRTCLYCGNTRRSGSAAWSYRCTEAACTHIELCLTCQLNGRGAMQQGNQGGGMQQGNQGGGGALETAELIGQAVGKFVRGLACACITA